MDEQRRYLKDLKTERHSFKSNQQPDHRQPPINIEPRWIRGILTPWPLSINKELRLGNLFIEDETGAVRCELVGGDEALDAVGSEITCHQWQYIYDEGTHQASLEVTSWEVHTRTHQPLPPAVMCVSVTTAASLLHNKERLKVKSIDVIGKVSYLSEIIRIKGDPLFMVQLDESTSVINILVKRADLLYWQCLLVPQKDFIFIGLRPTTLYKGTKQETRLFVPGESSQLLASDKIPGEPIYLKEWLHYHGEEQDTSDWAMPPTAAGSCKLYSYKGSISAVEDIQNGIYELDGKIRLYLSYIHAVHKFPQLRRGAEVLVYNAHHIAAPQHPKVQLCCCLVSCVKVTRLSTSDLISKRFEHAASHVIHLTNQRGLHVQQLDWLRTLQSDLCRRLAPHLTRANEVGSVLYKTLTTPSAMSGSCLLSGSARNMLQEFLKPDHSGCSVIPRETPFEPQFTLPSLDAVEERGESMARDVPKLRRHLALAPAATRALNDAACWSYEVLDPQTMEPPWVIVGVLTTDSVTGQVQLQDRTTSVDCVIAASSSTSSSSADRPEDVGKSSTCPYLLPRHLGRVVRLDRCQVVTERFLVTGDSTSTNYDLADDELLGRLRNRVYLQFSMDQVVFLSKPRDRLKQWSVGSRASHVPGQSKRTAQECNLDQLNEKGAKRQRIGESSGDVTDKVHLTEHRRGSDKTEKGEQVSYSSQLFILTQKDSLHVRSRQSQSPALCFYGAACLINPPVSHPLEDDHQPGKGPPTQEESGPRLPLRHVALCFQQGAVGWYHLLTPGRAYRLVSRRPLTASRAGPTGLQRAVDRADVRQCVPVTADTLVVAVTTGSDGSLSHLQQLTEDESRLYEKVKEQLKSSGKVPEFLSVQQTLNAEVDGVVHVKGVVVSRHFTRSQHQRAPHLLVAEEDTNMRLGGFHLCLTLADLDRPQVRLKLYLNPSHVSYPLGLLDGATVSVSRAQLKRSRRSAPYCQLLVASAVRVVSLPGGATAAADLRSGLGDGVDGISPDLTSLPLTHLADLWRRREEGVTYFRCVVHVHKVLYMRLWSDCATCGNMHKLGRCTYVPCRSTTSPNVKVKASVVVDDGTTSAFLTCAGDDSVRTLLDLDAAQWRELKLTAEDQGEVEFNQTSSSGRCEGLSPAMERLLAALCESWLVKRRLAVWARLTTFSSRGRWPRAAGVTEGRPTPQLSCLRLQPARASELLNDLLNDLLITGN